MLHENDRSYQEGFHQAYWDNREITERKRQIDRQTDKDNTDTHRHKRTHRETDRHAQADRQTHIHTPGVVRGGWPFVCPRCSASLHPK